MSYPIPHNEETRLLALQEFKKYLQSKDAVLQSFAEIAASICGVPVAMITMIERTMQKIVIKCGIDRDSTTRDQAFCAHTIMTPEIMEVEDALKDPRFCGSPLVTGSPGIRFYAGAPIVDHEGNALGALCVVDSMPRKLDDDQRAALRLLAKSVMNHLELHRTTQKLADALADLKTISGLVPICAHCKGIRNDEGFWQSVEQFLSTHSEVRMSHGICPGCLREHYPGLEIPVS